MVGIVLMSQISSGKLDLRVSHNDEMAMLTSASPPTNLLVTVAQAAQRDRKQAENPALLPPNVITEQSNGAEKIKCMAGTRVGHDDLFDASVETQTLDDGNAAVSARS